MNYIKFGFDSQNCKLTGKQKTTDLPNKRQSRRGQFGTKWEHSSYILLNKINQKTLIDNLLLKLLIK